MAGHGIMSCQIEAKESPQTPSRAQGTVADSNCLLVLRDGICEPNTTLYEINLTFACPYPSPIKYFKLIFMEHELT